MAAFSADLAVAGATPTVQRELIELWRSLACATSKTAAAVLAAVKQVRGPGGHQVSSVEEHEMLFRLSASRSETLRIGQFESLVIKDKNSVTRLVDRLEKSGMVTRRISAEDRRGTDVRLTDDGQRMLREVGPPWTDALQIVLGATTPAEAREVRGHLDAVMAKAPDALPTRFTGVLPGPDWATGTRAGLSRVLPDTIDLEYPLLWIALLRAVALIEDALENAIGEEHQLSRSEAEVILALRAARAQVTLSELATITGVSNSGITRIVDRLDRCGLVHRASHPTDRRVRLAQLTDAGRAQSGALAPTYHAVLEKALGRPLTRAQRHRLQQNLLRITDQPPKARRS